jgi:hypothetical protein
MGRAGSHTKPHTGPSLRLIIVERSDLFNCMTACSYDHMQSGSVSYISNFFYGIICIYLIIYTCSFFLMSNTNKTTHSPFLFSFIYSLHVSLCLFIMYRLSKLKKKEKRRKDSYLNACLYLND